YVMTADDPGVVYQLSTTNHALVAPPVNLPAGGLALAISNDGTRLYTVVRPTVAADPRRLLVLDTSSLAATPVQTLDVPGSAGGDVELATLPDGRLVTLS